VILRNPKSFRPDEQMLPEMIYPALGLAGRVGASAASPELSTALQRIIKGALTPVDRLEKQAKAAGRFSR